MNDVLRSNADNGGKLEEKKNQNQKKPHITNIKTWIFVHKKKTNTDRARGRFGESQFGKNDGKRRKKQKAKRVPCFFVCTNPQKKKKQLFIFLSFFSFSFYILRSLWKSRQ